MKEHLDIRIKNAFVYDGSGGHPYRSSIGIKGNKIVHIGNGNHTSITDIDAQGLVLCPGFIDTHAHSEFTILSAPECESKVLQGVTTEINGNCGLSAAPLFGEAKKRRLDDMREFDITERWSEFMEYFALLEERRPAINFATLTGHGNIRASVKGYSDGKATDEELSRMVNLSDKSFADGSLGFSTGLIYPPGVFTDTDELIYLFTKVKGKEELVYTSHMRSEGDRLIEAIEEALTIGRKTGMKVHISHLKTGGKENWRKADEVLNVINDAIDEGLSVTFDRYPYTGASTDLDTMLPSWTYEGGSEKELKRLKDIETRKKIIDHLKSKYKEKSDYEAILVSSVMTDKNRWIEGKSIAHIAHELKKTPEETVIDILIEENLRAGAIFMSMSEDNLRKFLSHPNCMIGSDSAVRNYAGITANGKPHPRGFGSFPRFLGKYVRDERLMPLEEGIRRVTSLPAETFSIKGRGLIKEGYYADVVVIDPEFIKDAATYEEPFKKPQGIEYVIVNGNMTISKGALLHHSGHGMIVKANN
jgi:N-acyl-D-amino-acid deacylase